MAELIIYPCNLSLGARKFLKRVHEHNLKLEGKLWIWRQDYQRKRRKSDMVQEYKE